MMRNVLLSTLMVSLYALSSNMDYVDAERLRNAQSPAVKAEATCNTSARACPKASKEQLALNGH